MKQYAIYERPGRYVVKPWNPEDEAHMIGLWAILAPTYTRETADKLADILTADMPRKRRKSA